MMTLSIYVSSKAVLALQHRPSGEWMCSHVDSWVLTVSVDPLLTPSRLVLNPQANLLLLINYIFLCSFSFFSNWCVVRHCIFMQTPPSWLKGTVGFSFNELWQNVWWHWHCLWWMEPPSYHFGSQYVKIHFSFWFHHSKIWKSYSGESHQWHASLSYLRLNFLMMVLYIWCSHL